MDDQIKLIRLNIDSSHNGFFDDLYDFGRPSLIGGKEYVATSLTRTPWGVKAELVQIKSPEIAWTGEAVPPVGTICEYKHVHEWQRVEVFAVKPNHNGSETALFTYENGTWCGCAEPSFFRPIRTPEQIKADERLHQVRNALTAIHAGDQKFPNDLVRGNIIAATVEAMIDAGYRKFEITDDSDPA